MAAVACVPLLAGCAGGGVAAQDSVEADPAFVVRVLPTRPGLDIAGPEVKTGPDEFDRATLGQAIPGLAKGAKDGGLRAAATRTWTGPDGARLVAVASLWDDSEPARAIGGQVAKAAVPGGTPWTPRQYGGSQGYRSDTARSLSVVAGKLSLLVIAAGPLDDEAVLRTVDLMRKATTGDDLEGQVSGG
ncbi:MAG: hypothetical protein ACKOGE_02990 [Actinomycetota bacterium]